MVPTDRRVLESPEVSVEQSGIPVTVAGEGEIVVRNGNQFNWANRGETSEPTPPPPPSAQNAPKPTTGAARI